jgi:methyl-accepting chemotaxis protein
VAAASQEQSAGVGQVSKAMGVVDTVTQRNASAAEELSSTAEEMASQAEALQQLTAFFSVREREGAARSRAAARSHAPEHPAPAAPAAAPQLAAPHLAAPRRAAPRPIPVAAAPLLPRLDGARAPEADRAFVRF